MIGWVITLILLAALVFLGIAFVFLKQYLAMFGRSRELVTDEDKVSPDFRDYIRQYHESEIWLKEQPREELVISSADHLRLTGELFRLTPGTGKVVLAMHGYHGGGEYDMARFARFYKDQGCDFLIISQRSHEKSEGKYIGFGYLEQKDGIAWCRKLIELYGEDVQIILHGVSMGAAAVCLMCGNERLPSQVRCAISDCSYDSLINQARHSLPQLSERMFRFSCRVLNFWSVLLGHYRLSQAAPVKAIRNCHIPILFIHGAADNFVPTVMVNELYSSCPETTPKWIFIVPGAGHACSYVVQPEEYEKLVIDFWKKASLS